MHTAYIITDLTFGDAGKGAITDALARRGAGLVVRYNGGAQAAHTVVDDRGRVHAFHQFGSGTLVEGVETFLSRYMLVNPIALFDEAERLREIGVADAVGRLHIDGRALVTTPYHAIANQLRELARGGARHGSCGLGIGETAADALAFGCEVLHYRDLADEDALSRKLRWHRDLKRRQIEVLLAERSCHGTPDDAQVQIATLLDRLESEEELEAAVEVFAAVAAGVPAAPANFLASRLERRGCTVFEGAQGVLLDENWGFHPYTTWSTTTPANALSLIHESGAADVETTVLGLTRTYQTRHGAGPFPTEDAAVAEALPEPHNPTNAWQGPFRAGWLDLALLRYAIDACAGRIDGLVMTCLDRLQALPEAKVASGYALNGARWTLATDHPGDLERQESDGMQLNEVDVVYGEAPIDPEEYARYVAEQLNLPLLGTSFGSTAQDKVFMRRE